jgi:hypothetical protein
MGTTPPTRRPGADDVDLREDPTDPLRLIDHPQHQRAFIIGWALVAVFVISVLGLIIAFLNLVHGKPPEQSEALINHTMIPFMQALESFAIKVFGPFLGIIIGFYLNDRLRRQ